MEDGAVHRANERAVQIFMRLSLKQLILLDLQSKRNNDKIILNAAVQHTSYATGASHESSQLHTVY